MSIIPEAMESDLSAGDSLSHMPVHVRQALSLPIYLESTAEELDADLAGLIKGWVERHQTLRSAIAEANNAVDTAIATIRDIAKEERAQRTVADLTGTVLELEGLVEDVVKTAAKFPLETPKRKRGRPRKVQAESTPPEPVQPEAVVVELPVSDPDPDPFSMFDDIDISNAGTDYASEYHNPPATFDPPMKWGETWNPPAAQNEPVPEVPEDFFPYIERD